VGGARRPVRRAELGFEPPAQGTRLQAARTLERQVDEQGLAAAPAAAPPAGSRAAAGASRVASGAATDATPVRLSTLAATIDRDVFGGREVSDAVVDDRWRAADASTEAIARASGRVRRLISRYRVHRRR
jgi:hypothetical protein